MQKTSFNKKIQKNPGDCITNISQHFGATNISNEILRLMLQDFVISTRRSHCQGPVP